MFKGKIKFDGEIPMIVLDEVSPALIKDSSHEFFEFIEDMDLEDIKRKGEKRNE